MKRLVYLNYRKINAVVEAKRRHEMEFVHLERSEADGDLLLRSDSTAGYESPKDEMIVDFDLEQEYLKALEQIKHEDDIVTMKDWEEFTTKKIAGRKESLLPRLYNSLLT